jgi:hypothetical protein
LNFRGRSETEWPEGEMVERYHKSFILIILQAFHQRELNSGTRQPS